MTSIIQGGQTNFVNSQTSYVDNQFSYVGNSVKMGLASEDISLILKLPMNTIAVNFNLMSASFNVVKFEMTAMSMKTKSVNLANTIFHCETTGIWVTT